MTAHSILFQSVTVRAILAGHKTQTRRIVKRPPATPRAASPYGGPGDILWVRESFLAFGCWETRVNAGTGRREQRFVDLTLATGRNYHYEADAPALPLLAGRGPEPGWRRRPALFMPRLASRLSLRIVAVRTERLQACSDADALAEGCDSPGERPVDAYRRLWESINGSGSWATNPLVWVIEFARLPA